MNTLPKLALIGVGGYGQFHREAIAHHQKSGRARLVAVADPAWSRLSELRSLLLTEGVRLYDDYQSLLEAETALDAVVIAAPIPYHEEIVRVCLERDLFVYLEKPPVPLLSQLDALLALDQHQRIFVGFQQIATDWMQTLKTWVARGSFGELHSLRATAGWLRGHTYYRRAAWAGKMMHEGRPVFDGPATNALAHLIHNIMYLAAQERHEFAVPVSVEGEIYRARAIASYDTSCLSGRFASGATFTAAFSHAVKTMQPFELAIEGSRGWARITEDGRLFKSNLGCRKCSTDVAAIMRVIHSHFLDFVAGVAQRPLIALADTRGYVAATNAMLLSSGGIHTISPEWVESYTSDHETGLNVKGLSEALCCVSRSGRLFSEQGCPWSIAGKPVSLLSRWKKSEFTRYFYPSASGLPIVSSEV